MPDVAIFHNIRWSRYKALVFSELHDLAKHRNVDVAFYQIADTSLQREALGGVDHSYHRYPHRLLFEGSYDAVPRIRMIARVVSAVLQSDARLIVLPGYERIEYWAMLAAAILSGKARAVACDSTINDRLQSPIKGLLKRCFFRLCHGFFAYGVRSKEYLVAYGADPAAVFQPCQAAALPPDYDEMRALTARLEVRRDDAPMYLYVGRLSAEKNLHVLMSAFSRALSEVAGARLVVAGAGPQLSELEAQAKRLEIGDAVIFAGTVDSSRLATLYSEATCLVLPSQSEPWGLVVNEALHYGCPVIVSDRCGCVPELASDRGSSRVVKAGDIASLAGALVEAAHAFSSVKKTSVQCQRVVAKYTPRAAAENILKGCMRILRGEA